MVVFPAKRCQSKYVKLITIMLSKDVLYAARTLRKSSVFTLTAVVTIAVGIDASTAIFSVTNAVLLRQLPYRDAGRLVIACGDSSNATSKTSRSQTWPTSISAGNGHPN
jgi:hypothetical protein